MALTVPASRPAMPPFTMVRNINADANTVLRRGANG